jgi:hypothetical protein
MNKLYGFMVVAGVLVAGVGRAQVSEIKTESASHALKIGEGGPSGTELFFLDLFLQVAVNGGVEWQRYVLDNKNINPGIVSVEVMLQGAAQPSQYYLLNPRVRANWGLLSTDFRQSYLLEERIDGGVEHLRTDEWQVLELNIVSARNAIFRIGGGIIHEGFNTGETYSEWTAALTLLNNNRKWGGMTEFRGSEPRNEWSAQVHYRVLERGRLQGYVTAGYVFQRYYSAVSVWGLQGGVMFRVH